MQLVSSGEMDGKEALAADIDGRELIPLSGDVTTDEQARTGQKPRSKYDHFHSWFSYFMSYTRV